MPLMVSSPSTVQSAPSARTPVERKVICGVVVDVEEVGRADVGVALLLAGVDRGEVDGRGHAGLDGVLGGDDLAGELAEVAADLADHHVADREADRRVDRIDGPGAGDVAGDLDGGAAGHVFLRVVERLTFCSTVA